MKKRQLILPYILLNILISAGTVFLALHFWDDLFPESSIPFLESVPLVSESLSPTSDVIIVTPKQPVGEVKISFEGAFGVGDLQLEYLKIQNQSETVLNLSGWQLLGGQNRSFTFPNLSLNRNGAVKLYSRVGEDSVIELFWNAEQALWKSGDEIELRDPNGNLQAVYVIP